MITFAFYKNEYKIGFKIECTVMSPATIID